MSQLGGIKSIEAVLSIDYERNDSSMSGDASLNLSGDSLNLRIYYLGFLAGEVKEENGVIHSRPRLDKYKSALLVDGLKNSFLWWNIRDYAVEEKDDAFILKSSERRILISKKTFLPVQQTVELEDGEELNIFYDEPAKADSSTSQPLNPSTPAVWYQSNLRIEFKNHIVRIKVKSCSVNGS